METETREHASAEGQEIGLECDGRGECLYKHLQGMHRLLVKGETSEPRVAPTARNG